MHGRLLSLFVVVTLSSACLSTGGSSFCQSDEDCLEGEVCDGSGALKGVQLRCVVDDTCTPGFFNTSRFGDTCFQ